MELARISREKHEELEAFWRFHHDEWARATLNQREYCELHGLPLKRFGNWWAQFKIEEKVRPVGLLHRRCGLRHMASHMSDRGTGAMSLGYIPSTRTMPKGRRDFSVGDKRRSMAEMEMPGASLSAVARRHRVDTRLLFRWKQQMSPPTEPVFIPVALGDGAEDGARPMPAMPAPVAIPIIVERAGHEIEVELIGGQVSGYAARISNRQTLVMTAGPAGGRSRLGRTLIATGGNGRLEELLDLGIAVTICPAGWS